MLRWELCHNHWRAVIDKEATGYVAKLYNRLTQEGRRGIALEKSAAYPTQRAARQWVYQRIDTKG